MIRVITLAIILFFITGSFVPAYAYLDPGTGGILVQGLLAGVASALAILKIYWRKIKAFITSFFKKSNDTPTNTDSKNKE